MYVTMNVHMYVHDVCTCMLLHNVTMYVRTRMYYVCTCMLLCMYMCVTMYVHVYIHIYHIVGKFGEFGESFMIRKTKIFTIALWLNLFIHQTFLTKRS